MPRAGHFFPFLRSAVLICKESTQAITTNIVNKGKYAAPLILYNRTRLRAEEHSLRIGTSAVVAASLKDVVTNADLISSCVLDEEAVEQIFAEILSSTQHNLSGKLFIESSTITSSASNRIAKQVLEAGGEFVALPGKRP